MEAPLQIEPIGIVHSPFRTQAGTPVQPALAGPNAVGTVEVFTEYLAGLDDLDGFERIWLLTWLEHSRPVQMKVVPYLDDHERGLFSTRAPTRPNPIGLSPIRLLRREGAILHVADLDLLDGTPVLDIKPYSSRMDSFPDTRHGWMSGRIPDHPHPADHRFAPEDHPDEQ